MRAHPHVLWRHDVDMSVHRALALARIEADAGAYVDLVLLAAQPVLQPARPGCGRARASDPRAGALARPAFRSERLSATADDEDDLEQPIEHERRLLEDWLERPVSAVSLHNPDVRRVAGMRDDRLAGLPNAYGAALEAAYEYVSDSNGYWRFRRLPDLLADADVSRLHVLTHPEWWTPEALSPRERVVRSVRGPRPPVLATTTRCSRATIGSTCAESCDWRKSLELEWQEASS